MARPCTICEHPQARALADDLAKQRPVMTIVRTYGVTKDALRRHQAQRHGLPVNRATNRANRANRTNRATNRANRATRTVPAQDVSRTVILPRRLQTRTPVREKGLGTIEMHRTEPMPGTRVDAADLLHDVPIPPVNRANRADSLTNRANEPRQSRRLQTSTPLREKGLGTIEMRRTEPIPDKKTSTVNRANRASEGGTAPEMLTCACEWCTLSPYRRLKRAWDEVSESERQRFAFEVNTAGAEW